MILTTKIYEDIRDCEDIKDLANLLNLDLKTLLYFAYKNDDLYKHYRIKKKNGGYRDIYAPKEALKTICKKLNYHFSAVYEEQLPKSVHGFVSKKSIVTNAEGHVKKNYILNIDISNFFGVINAGRVMGLLRKHPFKFRKRLASVLTGLTTYNNCLPQGSPCSPVLANMVCFSLDKKLIHLAHKNGWKYTRYADDISISANKLNDSLASDFGGNVKVGEQIVSIINKNGFDLNDNKTRLAVPNDSKWVTGVKINKKCNVSRKLVRRVRAMLNAWEVYGEDDAEIEFNRKYNLGKKKKFKEVLRGRIDHIGNVRGKTDFLYAGLFNRLCEMENRSDKRLPESKKEEYLDKVLMIKSSRGYGSGFFISKNIIITCAHVVGDDRNVEFTIKKKKCSVEFKSASVVETDKKLDYAILYDVSDNSDLVFKSNRKKTYQNCNQTDRYTSVGYAGFRLTDGFWDDPVVVDQKIIRQDKIDGVDFFLVDNSMWDGMSGGPVISKSTDCVVGYIVKGSESQEKAIKEKTFRFCPIPNIPEKFFVEIYSEKEDELSDIPF